MNERMTLLQSPSDHTSFRNWSCSNTDPIRIDLIPSAEEIVDTSFKAEIKLAASQDEDTTRGFRRLC